MMASRSLRSLALLAFFAAGCASIDFSKSSPQIGAFDPRSVAVLPFDDARGSTGSGAICDAVLAEQIAKGSYFTRVAGAEQVKAAMAQDPALAGAVTAYRGKWAGSGVSDAAQAAAICKALNVDSMLLGEINHWSANDTGADKFSRVGVNLRWVEASKGEVLWKASHTIEDKAGLLGSFLGDKQKKAAGAVLKVVMKAFPKK